jgi:hypothetical protein
MGAVDRHRVLSVKIEGGFSKVGFETIMLKSLARQLSDPSAKSRPRVDIGQGMPPSNSIPGFPSFRPADGYLFSN